MLGLTAGKLAIMPEIDEYTRAAIPLQMRFDDTELSNATGFIWRRNGRSYLITNWHNLTGINPKTGAHILTDGRKSQIQIRVQLGHFGHAWNSRACRVFQSGMPTARCGLSRPGTGCAKSTSLRFP